MNISIIRASANVIARSLIAVSILLWDVLIRICGMMIMVLHSLSGAMRMVSPALRERMTFD